MPRLIHRNPSYRKHRASGQAIVTLDGQDIYLGPFGTKTSRAEYDRVMGEWLANGRRLTSKLPIGDLSIAELVQAYWKHAERYYCDSNGEVACTKGALKVVRTLY